MPIWLHHPQACYTIAAYGVAAVALVGLLIWSLEAGRRRQAEWRRMQIKRKASR